MADSDKADRTPSTSLANDPQANILETDQRDFLFSGAGQMFLSDVDPVTVQMRDLTISVDTAPSLFEPETYAELLTTKFSTAAQVKTLLHSVSADFKPGTLTA